MNGNFQLQFHFSFYFIFILIFKRYQSWVDFKPFLKKYEFCDEKTKKVLHIGNGNSPVPIHMVKDEALKHQFHVFFFCLDCLKQIFKFRKNEFSFSFYLKK